MQRLTDFTKGLSGLVVAGALIGGIPYLLARFIGWPLPSETVPMDTISRHLADGDIPDAFLLKTVAIIVWLAWAQLAIAVVAEYVGIIRGRAPVSVPTLPAFRILAAKLATWTTLVVSALGPIKPVAAAPLVPVAATTIVVPTAAATGATSNAPEPVEVGEATADGVYIVEQGDCWWDVADRLLGDGMRWSEIRAINIGRTMPDGMVITQATEELRPNWPLAVPVDAEPALLSMATVGESEVRQTVIVEPGDHFWAIAETTLAEAWGRAPSDSEITPFWADLVELNREALLPPEDPNLIYPEQQFTLPAIPMDPRGAPDLNGSSPVEPPPVEVAERPDPAEAIGSVPVEPEEGSAEAATVEPAPVDQRAAVVPPSTSSAAEDSPNRIDEQVRSVGLIAGASALVGGLLLYTLRRLRRVQAARRRPGTITDPPRSSAVDFEQRIRAVAVDGEDVRYLAAVNTYLSHKLETSGTPMPNIVVARAGQHGVELLLDEPCEPVDGFVAVNSERTVWRLSADLDHRAMERQAVDAHPFAPALTVLGTSEAGNALVDLEHVGSLSVEGDPERVADFLRGVVASLCAAPWATHVEVVALGIRGLEDEDLSRVLQPSDPSEWVAATETAMRNVATNLGRSPYEERVMHGEVYHPMVVVVGSDTNLADAARALAAVADLAYSPLAVVSAHALASEHRVVIENDQATLEPIGLVFDPVALPATDLAEVDHLLANASDTGARPPAEDWAADEPAGAASGSSDEGSVIDLTDASTEVPPGRAAQASKATIDRIAEILAPQPIEVRILGRKPEIEGLTADATPKLEAIIVYLAFHREVVSQRFREEFWPESTSRQAADNAVMRTRGLLGNTDAGEQRLQSARSTNSYILSDDVGLDWRRVELLVAEAKKADGADEAAFLDAALSLVGGHVAVDARPAHYAWLLREPTIYTLIETTIVDAAHRRGELALASGDVAKARWAAEKGLAIVDGQEAMYRMKMKAASDAGDLDGVNAAYREAQRAAESYGYDDEVQPETQELYEELTIRERGEASRLSTER